MPQVIATRSELLARRSQIALAAQGRDVLKEKRDALMEAFRATVESAVSRSGALEVAAADGRRALAAAEAADGPDAVRSAALAQPGEITLTTRAESVISDQRFLTLAEAFEREFVHQSGGRSIAETLDVAWQLFADLPDRELKRTSEATLAAHRSRPDD